jgi:hypothetical protein
MNNKSLHRNVIPATAIPVAGVLTSQVETATWGKGIRFFVTVAAGTAAGGIDAIFLCSQVPGTGIPSVPSVVVPLVGFALANAFSVNGVYVADFYPGAWLPPVVAAGGALIGAAGIELPMFWAVQIQMGAGNAATIRVDAVAMP